MSDSTNKQRILDLVRTRLCSSKARVRERVWRRLVQELQAKHLTAVPDAITEFLTLAPERMAGPGARALLPANYHKLSDAEKLEVNALYQECLSAAMRDFPSIFETM